MRLRRAIKLAGNLQVNEEATLRSMRLGGMFHQLLLFGEKVHTCMKADKRSDKKLGIPKGRWQRLCVPVSKSFGGGEVRLVTNQ